MDLQTLKFKVETGELVSAVTAIKNLGTEVSKLNKPVSEAAANTEKLAQAQAKTATANAKAELATLKLSKAQEDSNKPLKESVSVLQRQQDILAFMTEGYSKGQSSVLAYAKAQGALSDELDQIGNALKTQRTLMGTDPFDKSIGTLEAWTNRLKVASEVQSLYNRNLGLTKGQMEELARDKLRLNELFKDKGTGVAVAEYEKLVKVASQTATTINAVTDSVKGQEKWISETAKANAYLEKEMNRLDTTLQETNKDLGSGSVNALIRFETALKKSGMTVQEQSAQLDIFKKKLAETNKASGNRQVDYLARALGPQITDIGVGLMTGQNPLTVMLQQGGQLRDQLALAGVAGKDMGKALKDSAAGMVGSIKDVGKAIGGLVVSSFTAAGAAVIKFGGDVTGVTPLMEKFRNNLLLAEAISGPSGFTTAFNVASKALQLFTGVAVLGAAAALVTFLMSIREVTKQESELTKAITLSGGALGLSSDQATALAKSFAGAKGNIGDFTIAITAAAKAGTISAGNLEAVTSAAIELNKAAGVPIEETIKQFSKLGDKPTEAVRELAKSSGLLGPEVLKAVDALEKQGKKTEAATLATNAYSLAIKDAAKGIEKDMGSFESLFHAIGSGAAWMWDQIANIGRKGDLETQLKDAESKMKQLTALSFMGVSNTTKVNEQTALILSLHQQIDASKKLGEEKLKNTAYAEWEIKYGKYAEQSLSKQARFEAEKVKLKEASIAAGATEAQQAVALAGLRKEIFGEAALPNNLELVQKAYGEELRLTQTQNDNKRKILKFYYDVGLKDRAEYVAQDTQLLEDSEAAQLKVVDTYQKLIADAYEIQHKALVAKTGAGSQDVKNLEQRFKELNKTLGNTKQSISDTVETRSMENMKAIAEVIKQAKNAYIDFNKTVETSQNQRDASYAAEKELAGTYGVSTERIKAYRDEYTKLIPAITAAAERVKQAEKELADSPAGTVEANMAITAVYETRGYLAKTTADAQVAAGKAASDAEARYNDLSIQRLNAYNTAFTKVFDGLADVIINFVQTGKFSMKSLVDSMIADLIRFEIQAQTKSFYSAIGGAGNLMGMLGFGTGYTVDATGTGMGSMGSVDTASLPAGSFKANGAAYSNGLEMFANGGTFTNSIVDSPTLFKFAKGTGMMGEAGPEAIMPLRRGADGSLGVQAKGGAWDSGVQAFANGGTFTNSVVDSPTLFKFAKGTGLMGEAGPEAIMPLRRGADGSLGVQAQGGSSANVSVSIINNTNAQATTQETTDSRGNRKVEVVIGDMTAGEVTRSGSSSQKAMKSTFGIQPALIRR